MKSLSKNQTVEKFNEILEEGIEYGFIFINEDLDFLRKLRDNLVYCLEFFENFELSSNEKSFSSD